jgi:drug/metabolite transporter (DMT)-like permease
MIFGHTVNNWALKYVSASIVSISLLGEPIIASILAFLILSEIPSVLTIVGGIITFTGILLAIWDKD